MSINRSISMFELESSRKHQKLLKEWMVAIVGISKIYIYIYMSYGKYIKEKQNVHQ